MKKADVFWQTYLGLEKELVEVSKYIYFTDSVLEACDGGETTRTWNTNLEVFSPHICDLLIRCCVEIEAIAKELYYESGGEKQRGDTSILFDKDCLKFIDIKWETHSKVAMVISPLFNFVREENRILRPLRKAHKGQKEYWIKAYQAVKHDRYSSMSKGNVKLLIHALSALYLLNLYYRRDSWTTHLKDIKNADYTMGSSVFAVVHPGIDRLWYGNNPEKGDSPYVAKFRDEDYKLIEEMQNAEERTYKEYLRVQPEFNDPEFISMLSRIKASDESYTIVTILSELAKYRLKKKISQYIPFEERKLMLLDSEEWRGWINQNNSHLKADEINEDNIQEEIDRVGTRWGYELMKNIQKLDWLSFAMNQATCDIFIPGLGCN